MIVKNDLQEEEEKEEEEEEEMIEPKTFWKENAVKKKKDID